MTVSHVDIITAAFCRPSTDNPGRVRGQSDGGLAAALGDLSTAGDLAAAPQMRTHHHVLGVLTDAGPPWSIKEQGGKA